MNAKLFEYVILNGRKAGKRFECEYYVMDQEDVDRYRAELHRKHGLHEKNKTVEDPLDRYKILFSIQKFTPCGVRP